MHTIDLTDPTNVLFKGCTVRVVEGRVVVDCTSENKKRLMRNILDYVESIPNKTEKKIVIIGPIDSWTFKSVFSTSVPYFKGWSHEDKNGTPLTPPLDAN